MDFRRLKRLMLEDEEDGGGEIIKETPEGIEYYDYSTSYGDNTLFFRRPKCCTKKALAEIIHVGDKCTEYGITKELVLGIIADAYKDMLPDMMCCLRGIIFFNGQEEFVRFRNMFIKEKEGEYIPQFHFEDGLIGKTWFDHQLAFVSVGHIAECVEQDELEDDFKQGLLDGVAVTAIHELRHIMLDGNIFLDEEKYPADCNDEDEVEDFSRCAWDSIRAKYRT